MKKPTTSWTKPVRKVTLLDVWRLEEEVRRLSEKLREVDEIHDEVWIEDGRIFYSHLCNGATLVQEVSKGWRISSSGPINPSFACVGCGAHFFATVIVQMQRSNHLAPFIQQEFKSWKGSAGFGTAGGKDKPNREETYNGSGNRTADRDSAWKDRDVPVERHPGGSRQGQGDVRAADGDWQLPGFSSGIDGEPGS